MTRNIYTYCDTIPGNCGVGYLYDIVKQNPTERYYWNSSTTINQLRNQGGPRWLLSGFTNSPELEEAYELLCNKYKLVYQSPVRRNENSGNNFFFCIFDTSRRRRAT